MTNLQTPEELQTRIFQGERLFSEGTDVIKELERKIKEHKSRIARLNSMLTCIKMATRQTGKILDSLKKEISLGK